MAWFYLLIAGLLETVWALSLKKCAEQFSPSLAFLTLIAMLASLGALYAAMRSLPLGIAYPLWTGIGSIGAIIAGAILFKEHINWVTIIGALLLIAGMTLISLPVKA